MKFIKLKSIIFLFGLIGYSYVQFCSDSNGVEDEIVNGYILFGNLDNTPIISNMFKMLKIDYFTVKVLQNSNIDNLLFYEKLKKQYCLLKNIYYNIKIDFVSICDNTEEESLILKDQYKQERDKDTNLINTSIDTIILDYNNIFMKITKLMYLYIKLPKPHTKKDMIFLLSKIFLKYKKDFLSINQTFKEIINIIPNNDLIFYYQYNIDIFYNKFLMNYYDNETVTKQNQHSFTKQNLQEKVINQLDTTEKELQIHIKDFKETFKEKIKEDSELYQLFTSEEQQEEKEQRNKEKYEQILKQQESNKLKLQEQKQLKQESITEESSNGTIILIAIALLFGSIYWASYSFDDKQEKQEELKENPQKQLTQEEISALYSEMQQNNNQETTKSYAE